MRPGPVGDPYIVISREFMGRRYWCGFNRDTGWTGPMRALDDFDTALRDRPEVGGAEKEAA